MCDVVDQFIAKGKAEGLAEGVVKGRAEGVNNLARLMNKLFSLNRIDDAKRATKDQKFCAELMKEFGIC